jgi:hypothetical protein
MSLSSPITVMEDDEEEQCARSPSAAEVVRPIKKPRTIPMFGRGFAARGQTPLYSVDFEHSTDHKKYVRGRLVGQGLFGTLQIVSNDGKNLKMKCMGCKKERSGAITVMIGHMKECKLPNVPEATREEHRMYLLSQMDLFSAKYSRDTTTAVNSRAVVNPNVKTLFGDDISKQQCLLQSVSQCALACNWSMLQMENPYFRQMLLEVSKMNLKESDLEVLNRKPVGQAMQAKAGDLQLTSKSKWKAAADTFGGSFSVDGWTSARNMGMIGLSFMTLGIVHYAPLIQAGSSSRASDYMEKVVPFLRTHMALMYFMCTDGASNMVKFGEMMLESHSIQLQLCAAHGFSLLNHYIGTAFENQFGFIDRITGIVAYFNRSPQRMNVLRTESNDDLGFIKVSKTRFAYMTYVFLRVVRLRDPALRALQVLQAPKKEEKDVDKSSTHVAVKAALVDDELFHEAELFVRVTFPVVMMMREFDRGVPMTGFVFWGFFSVEQQIKVLLDKVVETDPSKGRFRKEVMEWIAWIWEKRHAPIHSFAYLTNPLFLDSIRNSGEDSAYDLAPSFRDDIRHVLGTMIRKRYPEISDDSAIHELGEVINCLDAYLRTEMKPLAKTAARSLLASDWWCGFNGQEYGKLAYYAARVHAAPCVSSSLERFFSMITNVQTKRRASLEAERSALFTSAHHELMDDVRRRGATDQQCNSMMQKNILEFVIRLEKQIEAHAIPEINAEGIRDLESWLETLSANSASPIYRTEGEAPVVPGSAMAEETTPTPLEELAIEEDERRDKSSRVRRVPKRYENSL